jgi:hypothetical protein
MSEINNKDNFTDMVQSVASAPQAAPQAQAPANQQVILHTHLKNLMAQQCLRT